MSVQHLTRADALAMGLMVDLSDMAAERCGLDLRVHASADTVRAYRDRMPDVLRVVAMSTALLEGAPVTVEMHRGPPLHIAREPWGDGHAVTVILADGR